MKNSIKIGDLVYVPSDVTLFNESETHKLKKPINLLITGKKDTFYEVYYNGSPWYIKCTSVYDLKEEMC
jgi:hypothetical protein